jgi:hypothetical protein
VSRRHAALIDERTVSQEPVGGAGLADPTDTVCGWMRDGIAEATVGPFAAAAAHVSAYDLNGCTTTERAVALAARMLDLHIALVEVRPVIETAGQGA